jgi:putative redox protein
MVPITVTYQGQLRCSALHDKSNVSFITDAPTDNHGKGESFSPTDLVATALGSCMITTIGIKLHGEDVNLDGTRLAVEKHMSADPPRRISKIVVRLTFPRGIPSHYRQKIKEIGDTCPVAKSIHPGITLDIHYDYPD